MPEKTFHIRCPIHGSMEFDSLEVKLINHRYFQRLRKISQLGLAPLVFPGATHNRFSHSLGVCHLAGRLFDILSKSFSRFTDVVTDARSEQFSTMRRIFRVAGLLHDIGHLPFSHVLEKFLKIELKDNSSFKRMGLSAHEFNSIQLIYELAEEFSDDDRLIILSAANLLTGKSENEEMYKIGNLNFFPLMKGFISGVVDCDRMDYLQRDSYFCGVPYGYFDFDYLVNSIELCEISENEVGFRMKMDGIFSYQSYLMCRFHMMAQVYYHKTLLGFDEMFHYAIIQEEINSDIITGIGTHWENVSEDAIWLEIAKQKDKKWSSALFHRRPPKILFRKLNDRSLDDFVTDEILEELKLLDITPLVSRKKIRMLPQRNTIKGVYPDISAEDGDSALNFEISSLWNLSIPEFLHIDQISITTEDLEKNRKSVLKLHRKFKRGVYHD